MKRVMTLEMIAALMMVFITTADDEAMMGYAADGAGIREGVRSYSVYGKQMLDDAAEEWKRVPEGDEGDYRFFKVRVSLP